MTIGAKIKQLRKQRDITQEKLAEYLNISYQAISKWENENTMPDMSLVVPIANFFGVSTDTLFDLDDQVLEEDTKKYNEEAMKLANLGFVSELRVLWRKAVAKYPKNYQFLLNLAHSLSMAPSDQDDNEKHYKELLEEAVSICDRILEDCVDTNIRSSVLQILSSIYSRKPLKNMEKAEEAANMAAPIMVSREVLLASALEGEKKTQQQHRNNLTYVDLLAYNLYTKYDSVEERIFAHEARLKLYKTVMHDENYLFYHCRISEIHKILANCYCRLKSKEEVLEHLALAKKHAILFDTIPEGEHHYTSIFVKTASHNKNQIMKNYTSTNLELLRNELKDKRYDFLRHDEDFLAFYASLSGKINR